MLAAARTPGKGALACPQMIDPRIDFLTYKLLASLTPGEHAVTGAGAVRDLLFGGGRKPLAIVVTTDAVSSAVHDLRNAATLFGVPVVHALPRAGLGDAMRAARPLVIVAVTRLPDLGARDLLCTLMARAASACGEFSQRLALACSAAPFSAATVPDALAETLRALAL